MKQKNLDMLMEVLVGALVFGVLAVLIAFTVILSRENLLQKTYPLEATFQSVMGLREGDNVYVRGMIVGKIRKIEFRPQDVLLRADLTQPLTFHRDYRVEILPSSVLGGRYLSVFEGSLTNALLPPETVLRGGEPSDLIVEATETIKAIKHSLVDGKVLVNLEHSMQQIDEVTAQLAKGQGTLGKLIKDDAVYNDLKKITTDLKTVSAQLASGQGTLGKLIKDDAVYNDVKQITSDLKIVSDRLAKGQGTLGKLSKDDELYVQVKDLITQAQAALDDIRETAPISTFSSIFFGAF